MDDESMSLIATFTLAYDAKLAQSLLESAGIPTLLRNEHAYGKAIAGEYLELYVPAAAEQDAREILASQVSVKDLEAQADAAGPRSSDRD
jgi:hypothetical protein